MAEKLAISWAPSWADAADLVPVELPTRFDPEGALGLLRRSHRPSQTGWQFLGAGLRSAREALREMPLADIVSAIDGVARRWLDREHPPRRRARDDAVAATGLSPEVVDHALDVELGNYRADSLHRALRRELGTPAVLDGFQPDGELRGRSMAVGPSVTLAVFSGNVPGLPAQSIVRALLVKSAVIAKVPAGEPTFAAHFARSLHEADARLGDAIFVTYWDRSDRTSLQAALEQADAVIAYGSDEACAAIRAHVGPQHIYVEHAHKVSLGIISARYLRRAGADAVADALAVDVSMFNQHACLAPQVYLVEADTATARDLAGRLAEAMRVYAQECPLGTLDETDAMLLSHRRLLDTWTASVRPQCDVWQAPDLGWTVVLDDNLASASGSGNRVARIVPVPSLDHAVSALRPLARYLQNVGLGATGAEFRTVATALARMGACRISQPGRMAQASLVWRHDGTPRIAQLVRWCDIEQVDDDHWAE